MLEAPFCDSITLLNPTEHSIQYNAADIMLRIFRQYYPIRNVIFAVGEGFVIYAAVAIACWIKLGASIEVFDGDATLAFSAGLKLDDADHRVELGELKDAIVAHDIASLLTMTLAGSASMTLPVKVPSLLGIRPRSDF